VGRHPLAVDQRTLFSLASLTKSYTAALTLRLVEQRRLRLADRVGRWLRRGVPAGARRVTVGQLLGHTSLLPDYVDDSRLANRLADPNHRWRLAELLRAVRRPSGRPGRRFSYSNTNYLLLGAIDARAGGASFGALMRRNVLDPLGLRDTFVDRDPAAASRFAHSYEGVGGRLQDSFAGARGVPTDVWGPLFADGGVGATAADVARFEDALYGGRLLAPATLQAMLHPGPDGSYGLGSYRMRFDDHTWQGHDGVYGGYESLGFTDRQRGVTIVVLVNGSNDDTDVASRVWEALVLAYDEASAAQG
jgi:D-alanyl-D-alanine carboxypeptidase